MSGKSSEYLIDVMNWATKSMTNLVRLVSVSCNGVHHGAVSSSPRPGPLVPSTVCHVLENGKKPVDIFSGRDQQKSSWTISRIIRKPELQHSYWANFFAELFFTE